ncbi:MAG: hypothetical protein GY874_02045 [Desulfobacteraceae bacterium]|nr:hypothetical protein [Desulfobacteraceae bacterium]
MIQNIVNFKMAKSFFSWLIFSLFILLFWQADNVFCQEVSHQTAQQVAESKIAEHLSLYGDWNGSDSPVISTWETVIRDDVPVAYNFSVEPSGHLLIAVDDEFAPVLFYSCKSSFSPEKTDQPNSLEAWIVPELHRNVQRLAFERQQFQTQAVRQSPETSGAAIRIAEAWTQYTNAQFARETVQASQIRAATVTPLLSTAWGQDSPYNLQAPDNGCSSGNTLAGCVATAWAQVLRYWSWPAQGEGSRSYTWNTETLSVNFGAATYDWDNMPDVLTGSSSTAQQDAVSLLIYHLGVATDMDFGCGTSSSQAWADEILDVYFKYKTSMQFKDREDYADSSEWFALFQAELDADPPRPVILSIFLAPDGIYGGHEVIADGYQSGIIDYVHINYGWDGHEDNYYTITSNFKAGGYDWDAGVQYIVTGIEPDNDPPTVDAGTSTSVDGLASVQLSGSVSDPEGIGIASYQWTQTSGTSVSLSGADTLTPTFTAPEVSSELVFQLRADDKNRAYAVDTCTVTVNGTSSGGSSPNGDGNGGGDDDDDGNGCFIHVMTAPGNKLPGI